MRLRPRGAVAARRAGAGFAAGASPSDPAISGDRDEIAARLRAGHPVTDAEFDAWLPVAPGPLNIQFWTDVTVAARVAVLLEQRGATRVLDVGAGCGKFCVVGALSSGLSFTGVERRAGLVAAAENVAHRFGVAHRATFVHGDLDAVDVGQFDALYLYNPFAENLYGPEEQWDGSVALGPERFDRDLATVEGWIAQMPVGAHLVTYNGFGGKVPDTFDLAYSAEVGLNVLRIWHKARAVDGGRYWLEVDEATSLYEGRAAEVTNRVR